MLLQLRTDDAQAAGKAGGTTADILFTGDIVEVNPGAVGAGDDALGAENHAVVRFVVQRGQGTGDLLFGVLAGRLGAPADEDLVRIVIMAAGAGVVMMMVLMLVVIMMVVLMLIVIMMVVFLMVVIVVVLMLIVIMMVVFLMVVVVVVLMLVVIMMVMMIMVMIMVMVGFVVGGLLGGQTGQLLFQGVLILHSLQDQLAVQLFPGVVMMGALALCSRNRATVSSSFFSLMPPVRLRTIAAACSIWLL